MRIRPRRLRRTEALRTFVAETQVRPQQLIQPHFVVDDPGARDAIDAMPGIERMGVDTLVDRVRADLDVGLNAVLLFGVLRLLQLRDVCGHGRYIQ